MIDIKYGFARNGDFVVGDLVTRRTARLFKFFAKTAKKEGFAYLYDDAHRNPEKLANRMLANVVYFKYTPVVKSFDERNWKELERL